MTDQPPNRAQRRVWPKRRAWTDRVAHDQRLTTGCKSFLALVAARSDDQGKPCWGRQEKMAEQLGRSRRSVIRYVAEAEELGYLKVYRSTPERDRSTGKWCRRRSNSYYFVLPARAGAEQPAPRRRERAGYCVVASHRRPSPHLRATDETSSPSRGATTGASPPTSESKPAAPTKPTWTGAMSPLVTDSIAQAKAHLLAARRYRPPVNA